MDILKTRFGVLIVCAVCVVAGFLFVTIIRPNSEIPVYRKATYSIPAQFDPINSLSTADAALAHLVYDGLVRVNSDFQTLPALAESWKISADGREYTFQIRPAIRFHDGKPLTVSDVMTSLDRIVSPDSPVKSLFSHVSSISIKPPAEIVIRLKSAYPPFLSMLAAPISKISRPNSKGFFSIGTGMFIVQNVKGPPGSRILTLLRNEHYFGQHPAIRRLELVETNESGAIDGVRDGNIHDTILFPSASNRFPRNGKAKMVAAQSASTWLLALNVSRSPTSNLEFRRCISKSFDRAAFVKRFLPDHQVASGFIPPGLLGHFDSEDEPPTNLTCGRYRGTSVAIDYPEVLTDGAAMCQLMATYFSTVGVESSCHPLDFERLLARIKSKEASISFLSQSLDLPDVDYFVNTFETGSPINLSNLSDPKFDLLAKQARAASDRAVRAGIYRKINMMISDLALTVNISYPRHIGFFHRCLTNTGLTVLGEASFDYSRIGISQLCTDRGDFRQ